MHPLRAQLSNTADALVGTGRQVGHSDDFVLDVEELVAGKREGRSFTLELEDDQSVVMTYRSAPATGMLRLGDLTSSKEVQLRMSRQDPEPIVLPPEGLNSRSLCHIPDPDSFVLTGREDELMSRVEHGH